MRVVASSCWSGTARAALIKMRDVFIDGEAYDRAFYAYTLEELKSQSEGLFAFDHEIGSAKPSIWGNNVFKRVGD